MRMTSQFRALRRLTAAVLTCLAFTMLSERASAEEFADLVGKLAQSSYSKKARAVETLAATSNPLVVPILEAMRAKRLFVRKSDGAVVIGAKGAGGYSLTDAAAGKSAGTAKKSELKRVRVNNKVRRAIRAAMGSLTLLSPDIKKRRSAAASVFKSADRNGLGLIETALKKETDPDVKTLLEQARAAITIKYGAADDKMHAAIAVLTDRGDEDALALLSIAAKSKTAAIAKEARAAITHIEHQLALWGIFQNIFYGLSLGSVLLLAAIGLAITFGVLGVINMAHGEMVMIGAYTTFVVQEVIRTSAPELFGVSLFIAVPLAFLVSGSVGVAIERGVIQFLYGRPLETLLATWGISLVLQQAVRTIFGPTNREVGTPDWMAGAFKLGQLTITWNRLWIIVFSMIVFAVLLVVLRRTAFGLQMRAVTQNRRMAGAMGIRTTWIDAMTFGLGSGIAGIAGVALSQIDNVSPNLGQSYIIDSFMVVVFGGVGNLWGTLVAAMTLGVSNKFLEPYAGAVLAKILVLVFIILFIQKRPRGLFALKGRAVES